MVKFIDVDPEEIPQYKEGRRGRVSYPIIKSFLETGKPLVKLDRTGMQQSFQSLYSCLNGYAKNHELPVKIFSRQGELYLMRLDIDKDGKFIEDWKERNEASEGSSGAKRNEPARPVTAEEVAARFAQEKDQITK